MSGMKEYAARVTKAFAAYGESLSKYMVASETAYNVGAEFGARLITIVTKGGPFDPRDLAAEAEQCAEAGKRALQASKDLKAAWDDLGKSLNLGAWRKL